MRTVKQWSTFTHRGCAVSILGGFQDQLHKALSWSHLVVLIQTSWGHLNPPVISGNLSPGPRESKKKKKKINKKKQTNKNHYTQLCKYPASRKNLLWIPNGKSWPHMSLMCGLTLAGTCKKEIYINRNLLWRWQKLCWKTDKVCDWHVQTRLPSFRLWHLPWINKREVVQFSANGTYKY